MICQCTLTNTIGATGVGLHTGCQVHLTLKPAPEDAGIIFRRVDLDPVVDIPATPKYVSDTRMSTTLTKGAASVSTVEHLMSALAGLGVDNAYVEVDAPEVPIMDGSASPFVFLIQSAGVRIQRAHKQFIQILKTVQVEEEDKWARFEPYDGFKVSFKIDFDHPLFKESKQSAVIDFNHASFVKEVSRARTFGFMSDLESLKTAGLARGGGLHNAVVLDDTKVLNEDKLRFQDEMVKHKVLDAIGDLYLLGHPVIGAFSAYKSGHAINNRLLKKLIKESDAWAITSLEKTGLDTESLSAASG